ncbi:MAG: hypothetical protein OEX81_03605 [Candidatus Pacebacteria bacterium]|nr:hypothetical protein [Candidatus Paceibacterota bacterium]
MLLELEFGLFPEEWEITEVNTYDDCMDVIGRRWDLALIDGNFHSWDKSGDDGVQITNGLANFHYPTYIVGISADQYQTQDFWEINGAFLKKPVGYSEIKAALMPLFTMAS